MSSDRDAKDEQQERDDEPRRKRVRISRARTACYQCRMLKTRCGGTPGEVCPNCRDMDKQCDWPLEDRRTSAVRARVMREQAEMGDLTGVAAKRNDSQRRSFSGQAEMPQGMIGIPGGVQMPTHNVQQDWVDGILGRTSRPPQNGGQSGQSLLGQVYQTSLGGPGPSSMAMMPRYISDYPSAMPSQSYSDSMSSLGGGGGGQTSQMHSHPSISDPSPPVLSDPFGVIQSAPLQQQSSSGAANNGVSPLDVDPSDLIWALSSQLPIIEEGAWSEGIPSDKPALLEPPPSTSPGQGLGDDPRDEGKTYRVTWWRPHGKTAIAPGLKRITLKVRVNNPQATWRPSPNSAISPASGPSLEPVIGEDGLPTTPIMLHLLDVFTKHFGCQFPFVNPKELSAQIAERTGSVFLFHSIAAIAARFSTHPSIALPGLKPWAYGNVFFNRAKALLGSMLGVPLRETTMAFVLLANVAFANDSECEIWMMTGLAVRMALDLALHLDPSPDSKISAEERRLNRLVFWSVLNMDHAISHGAGRRPSFPLEDITQTLPTEEDIFPDGKPADAPRSPFPFAAKQMLLYGPIITMLNRQSRDPTSTPADLHHARGVAMREYNQLPQDMQWSVTNLQKQHAAGQSSIFIHLHLWMHNILATAYLTGTSRDWRGQDGGLTKSGMATPNMAAATNLWLNSARTIGDILVLSDIINPFAYFSLPFVNQAFFVAGCCYVKEIEQNTPVVSRAASPAPEQLEPPRLETREGKQDFSRALLKSVAHTNISTLQQGLARQTDYWAGVAWVSAALAQRIDGVKDVDLAVLTDKLASHVSLPDPGLVDSTRRGEGTSGQHMMGSSAPSASDFTGTDGGRYTDFDIGQLLDMGINTDGAQAVVEQDFVLPTDFAWDWLRPA